MALPPTAEELASFMHLSPGHAADVDGLLEEVLSSAVEWATHVVGPLGTSVQTLTVHASGRNLVLPVTHLTSVASVTDPTGATVPVAADQVNLMSGIVTVPYTRKGAWTVQVTTDRQAASIALAIKIVAKHLYEIHRGRAGGARVAAFAGGGEEPAGSGPLGFAIPARAADLVAPFRRIPAIA